MKNAVIFDMYETLITLWHEKTYTGKEIARDAGIEESKFREIWDATDVDRTLGITTYEEVIEQILLANGRYTKELYQKLLDKRKASKLHEFEHIHTQIIPMLGELKKQGIKIGLITNCYKEEKDVIVDSVLFDFFDVVCMSCDLGLKKPDKRIFEICIDRLGVKAEECLYCGDGGSNELEVADKMNMLPVQALWYLRDDVKQPVGRLHSFKGAQNPKDIVTIATMETI